MENTVESVLSHGDKPPQELIEKLKSGANNAAAATALDEQLARALSQGQSVTQSKSRSGGASGGGAPSTAASQKNKGQRGAPTKLPDDFLRIPDRKYLSDSQSNLEGDEALARMLQDELFSEELARNPDFAHLAGGRRPRNSRQTDTAVNAATARSNVWNGPGFPARNVGGQQQPLPNIMEKLSGKTKTIVCTALFVFICTAIFCWEI